MATDDQRVARACNLARDPEFSYQVMREYVASGYLPEGDVDRVYRDFFGEPAFAKTVRGQTGDAWVRVSYARQIEQTLVRCVHVGNHRSEVSPTDAANEVNLDEVLDDFDHYLHVRMEEEGIPPLSPEAVRTFQKVLEYDQPDRLREEPGRSRTRSFDVESSQELL